MAKRGFHTVPLELAKRKIQVPIRTSARVGSALDAVLKELTLFEAVKLRQFFEATYEQGRKDGAREVFDRLDDEVAEAKRAIPHLNPGRPKKSLRALAGTVPPKPSKKQPRRRKKRSGK